MVRSLNLCNDLFLNSQDDLTFQEHPNVTKRNESEVVEFRQKHEITVIVIDANMFYFRVKMFQNRFQTLRKQVFLRLY